MTSPTSSACWVLALTSLAEAAAARRAAQVGVATVAERLAEDLATSGFASLTDAIDAVLADEERLRLTASIGRYDEELERTEVLLGRTRALRRPRGAPRHPGDHRRPCGRPPRPTPLHVAPSCASATARTRSSVGPTAIVRSRSRSPRHAARRRCCGVSPTPPEGGRASSCRCSAGCSPPISTRSVRSPPCGCRP